MKFQILNLLISYSWSNSQKTKQNKNQKNPLLLSTILCIHHAFTVSLKTQLSALWCLISLETKIQLKSEFTGNRLSEKLDPLKSSFGKQQEVAKKTSYKQWIAHRSKHTLNAGCQERCKGAHPNTPVAECLLVIPSEWHFQIRTLTHMMSSPSYIQIDTHLP